MSKAVSVSLGVLLLIATVRGDGSPSRLATADSGLVPAGFRFSALDWSGDGKEVRVLYIDRKNPPTLLLRRLDASLQDKGGMETVPPWDESTEKELALDLRAGLRLQQHMLAKEHGGSGYFIYPLADAIPLLRLAGNELNFPKSFAFSPDARLVAIGGDAYEESVMLCDIAARSKLWETLQVQEGESNTIAVEQIVFSSSGEFVASQAGHNISVRKASTGEVVHTLSTPDNANFELSLLGVRDNGSQVLMRRRIGSVECMLVDLSTGMWTHPVKVPTAELAWDASGDLRLLAVLSKGNTVKVCDLQTGRVITTVNFKDLPRTSAVAMSPPGDCLVIAHDDDSLSCWSIPKP